MHLYWWQLLDYFSGLLGILCISLAIFVLRKSPSSKKLTHIFALFASSMGLWMISVAIADLTKSLPTLVLWTKIATLFSAIGVISFAGFGWLFRRPNISLKYLSILLVPAVIIIFYVLTFPNNEVYTVDPFLGYNFDKPLGGVVNENYALYIPALFLFIIASLVILLKGRKLLPRQTRNQISYLAAGTTVMMFSGIIFDSILPVLGIDYLYSLGPALAVVWVGATAYAIVRHELMDIRIIIQRGVIYSLLFGVIAGVYLILIFGLNSIFDFADKTTTFISGLIAVILGIFGIPPLEQYFRKITDRFFFKDRYDYAQTLHELSAILNNSIEQQEIIDRAQGLLKKSLRTDSVILSLSPMENDFALQIPLIINDKSVGTLAVGSKLSGDPWNSSDLKLLDTFAYQAAVALEKSRLYQELKNQELQEQQKLMILDIAHNLQTPLTALQAELTLEKKDFAGLEKSISEVSKFIYDLLTLARLENKIGPLSFQKINISEILSEVVEYVDILASAQNIKLEYRIEPNVTMLGNAEELKILITNLLSNAIKYTQGQARTQIRVDLHADGKIILKIKDTGVGIAPDELPNIFQRFYRTNTKTAPGSGLGLAICQAVVEKHGGEIKIESKLKIGTEVKVELPRL